jgi:hypothetical protein
MTGRIITQLELLYFLKKLGKDCKPGFAQLRPVPGFPEPAEKPPASAKPPAEAGNGPRDRVSVK